MKNLKSGKMDMGQTMPSIALVSLDQVTHRAIKSGDWTDPATWEAGQVPTQWSHVHIPDKIAVRVDAQLTEQIKTVRVDGTLRFATDTDTTLRVDTLVTTQSSKLEIGTAENPVAADVNARIIFADDGVIDQSWDAGLLSRGALVHGQTTIFGAEKTAFTTLGTQPAAGDNVLTLSTTPNGWQVGDVIVVAGVDPNDPTSDEKVTIAQIAGNQITLERPLALDHIAPQAGLDVHVANLTRNITFSSENDGALQRGHVMFMHTNDADVNFAAFTGLGRTNKQVEIDGWNLLSHPEESIAPAEMVVENLGGTNVSGRYSVHFHRGGSDLDDKAAKVNGAVVTDDPGWAFVNHSSHVDFTNNVTHNIVGAAYNTEAGDEIGSFVGNIALRTVNPTVKLNPVFEETDPGMEPDARVGAMDHGWQGDGFWLHGAGVELADNVVSGASGHGYIYWTLGLVEKGLGEMRLDVANLPNGTMIGPDGTLVRTKLMPVPTFDNNDAYSTTKGLQVHYLHTDHRDKRDQRMEEAGLLADVPQAYEDQLLSTFKNSTYWNVGISAVDAPYSGRIVFDNITAVGNGAPGTVGVRLDHFANQNALSLINSSVKGFDLGVSAPRQGAGLIENVFLDNRIDVMVTAPLTNNRDLTLKNLTFENLDDGVPIVLRAGGEDSPAVAALVTDLQGANPAGALPSLNKIQDRIVLEQDGIATKDLFFAEQAADFIPFPKGSAEATFVDDGMIGLTNAQISKDFSFVPGGIMLPADAKQDGQVMGGFVAEPRPAITEDVLKQAPDGTINFLDLMFFDPNQAQDIVQVRLLGDNLLTGNNGDDLLTGGLVADQLTADIFFF